MKRKTVVSVSYTHLDVYKRQVLVYTYYLNIYKPVFVIIDAESNKILPIDTHFG